MAKSDVICGLFMLFGPGIIVFTVGMSLSTPKHHPHLFWWSLFSPIYVTFVWTMMIAWMCPSPPPPATPSAEAQELSTVNDQQNCQQESSNITGSVSPSIGASFPTYIYLREASKEDRHCSLCNELLRQGELATRLPVCVHSYHKGCIDSWLESHVLCPDCGLKLHPLPGEVAIVIQ